MPKRPAGRSDIPTLAPREAVAHALKLLLEPGAWQMTCGDWLAKVGGPARFLANLEAYALEEGDPAAVSAFRQLMEDHLLVSEPVVSDSHHADGPW